MSRMTNEEAINQIEEFMVIDDWPLVYMPQLHEALDIAIIALQRQNYSYNSKEGEQNEN